MRTFYINPETGDFEMDERNQLKMVEGDDAIIQAIWVTITTNLGEYFLNRDMGMDRFAILGDKFNEERTMQEVTDAILQNEMVESVEDIKVMKDGRKIYISFVVRKVDGDLLEGGATL